MKNESPLQALEIDPGELDVGDGIGIGKGGEVVVVGACQTSEPWVLPSLVLKLR